MAAWPRSFALRFRRQRARADSFQQLVPRTLSVRTDSPKASEITRKWFVIDAEDLVLGRLSTEAARILRGKHKPVYAPHLDMGDHVIIVNAEKVVLTSDKADKKMVYSHSGYPGGL